MVERPTLEQAARCPRCDNPGEAGSVHEGPQGSEIKEFWCRQEGCRWENTSWIVQVNRDGSIPIRQKGEKDFEPLTETQKQHGRDVERWIRAFATERAPGQPAPDFPSG